MKTSKRTKSLKKKRNLFFGLCYGLWAITALFFAIYAFCTLNGGEIPGAKAWGILSDSAQAVLTSLGVTVFIGLIAAIFIKEKIRTFIWMLSLVLAVILFEKTGMFVCLSLWLIDDYVFHPLYVRYKNLVTINKEIDRR